MSISADFVRVDGGWFVMGSDDGRPDERPAHRVWVDAFEIAVYPVTREAYARFLGTTNHPPPRDWDHAAFAGTELPVVGVSWDDAVRYCRWSTERDEPCRLPTEAEWEYAARGGREGERYPWGNEIPPWVPNAGRGPLTAPWTVRFGEPSPLGLFGIAANIHEWCADWLDPGYYAVSPDRNPPGPEIGTRRASRGGSWRHALTLSRTSARSGIDPSFRYNDYGFRVARSFA